MRTLLPILAVSAVLAAAGCGKQQSNGFGAATQPPVHATTGISTSEALPTRKKYDYGRPFERKVLVTCLKSGASEEMCANALARLENTVPRATVEQGGIKGELRKVCSRCGG